jgi:flagellar biosynthesis/type III secretory pathway protein FliH
MNPTWFEKGVEKGIEQGIEKGIEQGIEQGRRELLREQLRERFGALPERVEGRLAQLPAERLTSLSKAILRAQSLQELGLED